LKSGNPSLMVGVFKQQSVKKPTLCLAHKKVLMPKLAIRLQSGGCSFIYFDQPIVAYL